MGNLSAKIKILFIIDTLDCGGTEHQLMLLVEKLSREHFDPVIGVLYSSQYHEKLKIKTPVVSFNLSGLPLFKSASLLWRLKRFLDEEKFDIVQSHFTESEIYSFVAARFSRQNPILISTRRDLYFWINEEKLTFRLGRRTIHWADQILVNSYKASEACQEMERVPEEKIAVIHNGVEVDKFNLISTEEAKQIIGLKSKQPVVGVLANWKPVKGLSCFLKAAALVSKKIQNAHFILVGSGSQENELISLANELGLSGSRVTFLENPANVPTVVAAFDVAVQPSLSESFSNVLIEYMAAAKPIVATGVGDAEKVIEHEKNGLIVQPDNPQQLSSAILTLCDNRAQAAEFGQRARKRVEANWSSDKMLENYQACYRELVQKRRGKP